jgi:hypothetical protein
MQQHILKSIDSERSYSLHNIREFLRNSGNFGELSVRQPRQDLRGQQVTEDIGTRWCFHCCASLSNK